MREVLALALAGLGGGALALALREAGRSSAALSSYAESALRSVALAGREGRAATEAERRRLAILASAAISIVALLLFGAGPAALLSALGPVAAGRLLAGRTGAYRRAFERGIPSLASALADSVSAGASLRNALIDAATAHGGAVGAELRRVRADLELGCSPHEALGALERRLGSDPVTGLVGAALSQQYSGGDLADLLRRHAAAESGRRRALEAGRSATSQARLTGGMVAAMPVAAALLVELIAPGFIRGILSSPAAALLLLIALCLQLVGYLAIQRLGRVHG